MNGKILLINYSLSLTQADALINKNRGKSYFSSQKEALLDFLISKYNDYEIELLGLSSNGLNKEKLNNITYIRVPLFDIPFMSLLIFNLYTLGYIIFNHKKIKIIITYSGSEIVPYIGSILLSGLIKIPYFIILRNPPESLSPFRKKSVLKQKIAQFLDFFCFTFSSKIIHISPKSKELLKKYDKYYKKSIVLGSCPNKAFYDSEKTRDSSRIIFVYWGYIDKFRDLDTVIQGFGMAQKLDPDFDSQFYIIGGGDDMERLKNLTKTLKINNISFIDYLKQTELCKFLNGNTIAVIPIPQLDIYHFSAPLKLAEAMIMEIPVIASRIEPNLVIEEKNLGILCGHSLESYSEAFLSFYKLPVDQLNIYIKNIKEWNFLFSADYIFLELSNAIEKELR